MSLRPAACAALWSVLCVFTVSADADAQNASGNLKEVQVAGDAFSLADPIPSWVEPIVIPLPQPGESRPIVVRLADAQWLVGSTPVVHVPPRVDGQRYG